MALFGLDKIINQVTAPFGVKLFPGGPYADKGAGAKSDAYMRQFQEALRLYAKTAGLPDPFVPMTAQQANEYDPTALTGPQSALAARQLGQFGKAEERAVGTLRANLARRGINDPRLYALAEQEMRNYFDTAAAQMQAQLGEEARQNRQQALMNIMSALQGGAGFQQSVAQQNLAQQNLLHSGFGALLGLLLPYLTGSPGGAGRSGGGGESGKSPDYATGYPTEYNPFSGYPPGLPWYNPYAGYLPVMSGFNPYAGTRGNR